MNFIAVCVRQAIIEKIPVTMKCSLVFLLAILSLCHSEQPLLVAFLVSGSKDFGGNVDQKYHDGIRSVVTRITNQLNVKIDKFGAAWASPASATSEQSINSLVNLTKAPKFIGDFSKALSSSPFVRRETDAGLGGSLKYLEEKFFNNEQRINKVAFILARDTVPSAQITKATEDQLCAPILTFVILFPEKGADCNQAALQTIGDVLPYSRQVKSSRAICSNDITSVGQNVQATMTDYQKTLRASCTRYQQNPSDGGSGPVYKKRYYTLTSERPKEGPAVGEFPWYKKVPAIVCVAIILSGLGMAVVVGVKMAYDQFSK